MQTQEDSSSVPENIDLGAYNKFTIPNIVALYSSPFAQGYSDQQRQATIHALLRHGAHTDGAHYHTKTPNGLHPGYPAFTTVEKSVDAKTFHKRELIEASLNDLFDAVTMQDCLDGGISVLLRCPGFQSHIPLMADQIMVDAYVILRELIWNKHVSGDMAMLVQAFCEEFAIPHMQCFTERCTVESVVAPRPHGLAQSIDLDASGLRHLPAYSNPLVSHLQCTGVLDMSKYSAANGTRHLSASAAIRASASVASSANTVPPALKTQTPVPANPKTPPVPSAKKVQSDISSPSILCQQSTCQCRPAEVFLYEAAENFPEPIPLVLPTETEPKKLVLISIGPNTDAVLDCFNLGDEVLPTLHSLITRVRSSRWEVALWSSPWNLTYEQATNLAGALAADLKGNMMSVTPINPWNAYCWKKGDQSSEVTRTQTSHIRVDADKENGPSRDLSILPAFVKQNLPEYHTLTADEKEQFVKEYSEHIIDRKTLNAIKEELLNLRACTGVEAILYAMHGSTDLPLHAVTFETEGVKEFMGAMIHMDTLDFISKMEGFAI
ncbi:hypothetical protein L210DRAFT_3653569 [Boletus edulis BED1]|uniref:Uncharacterized protein n=1 Tax=Boletus edulis BED1 TaxID=1328754 RepID=A0AAD4BE68_BOLED|nr:hypothetical protein L210DRAFT_3653569 [Boletus edulis BED1]